MAWTIQQQSDSWFVLDEQGQPIAEADTEAEARIISAAPEMQDVLYDAIPVLRALSPTNALANRALRLAVNGLNQSGGSLDNLIDAAPHLRNALGKAMVHISGAAAGNASLGPLQMKARAALRKALG